MIYAAAFDVTAHNALSSLGTITMGNGAQPNATVTYSTVTSLNVDASAQSSSFFISDQAEVTCIDESPYSLTRFGHFSEQPWHEALQSAMTTAMTAQGWAGDANFSWSATTGLYTLSWSGGNTTLSFNTTTGRELMGFTGNKTSAASHTSDQMPWFVIVPTLTAVSDPTTNYEPAAIGNRISTDSGAGMGVARYNSPLHRNWRQEFETREKMLRMSAASTAPWTFQHLYEHCRGRWPFVVYDGSFHDSSQPEVFSFRTDGIPFEPKPATPGNGSQYHIEMRCVVEGELTITAPA